MLRRSPIPKIRPYRATRKGNFGEKKQKGYGFLLVPEIMAVPKETRVSYDNVSVIKSYGFP
jgi:hypothetical protein